MRTTAGFKLPTTVLPHRGGVRFLYAGHTALGRLGILLGKDSSGSERLVVVMDDSAQRDGGALKGLSVEADLVAPRPGAIRAIAVFNDFLGGAGRVDDVLVIGGEKQPQALVRFPDGTSRTVVARDGVTEVTGQADLPYVSPGAPSISIPGVSAAQLLTIDAPVCLVCS